MRIELFQDLYERYSGLALSFPSDRPVAIKGLETRLMDTFATTGGYGVFDIYLHRCLLWQRAGDTLKRIKPSRGSASVPSWSWMAHDGPIRYMVVPFGQASWCDNITSPSAETRQQDVLCNSQREGEGVDIPKLELEATVWKITDTEGAQMILDDPQCAFAQPLHCVVVGKSKTEPLNYVLLVHVAADVDDGLVYERVGVGVLDKRHIALDGPHRKARIR
jgi:hypothetical protein